MMGRSCCVRRAFDEPEIDRVGAVAGLGVEGGAEDDDATAAPRRRLALEPADGQCRVEAVEDGHGEVGQHELSNERAHTISALRRRSASLEPTRTSNGSAW